MRAPSLLLLLLLLPAPSQAQVQTDSSALDALKAANPPPPTPTAPAPAPPAHPRAPHKPAAKPVAAAKLPPVPAAPPANPVLAPPPPVLPTHAREAPPPVPVLPAATGTASPIPDGTRITFGAGSADLNPTTYAALVAIAAQANQDKLIEITLSAWAPGSNDDPSTPRRLSLDRALAGRAVLIHAGVASERIHAVAKGFIDIGADTPDRMDIIAAHPRATPAPKPPAPTKAAPK